MAPSLFLSYLEKTAKIAVSTHTGIPYGSAYEHLAFTAAFLDAQLLFLTMFKISSRLCKCVVIY